MDERTVRGVGGRMMIDTMTNKDVFAAAFDRLAVEDRDGETTWLAPVRRKAMDRFGALGFPTTRHEDWRYTNVSAITGSVFEPHAGAAGCLAPEDVATLRLEGVETSLLVFVNGLFAPNLSAASAMPDGVRIGSLADAMRTDHTLVEQHLTRHATFADRAFPALNTAFIEDGAFIHVPRGVVVETPIHLLFVTTSADRAIVTHPRVLVIAEAQSGVTLIEDYAGLGRGAYFTNAVTEIVAGEDATVEHYKIEQEGAEAFHVAARQVHQSRGSRVSSHTVTFGGALVRNDISATLDGENCDCELNGLYVLNGSRHADNHLCVDHAKPHCESHQRFKGVLDDRSHGVFTGRIIVREDAQKTDAKQTNQSLLLSPAASVDTRPQLEILADDVKCTHGATVGQLDDKALFYLRSRGLDEQAARSLMIYAFASERLSEIRIEPLRRRLQGVLVDLLPHGGMLRGVV